MLENWKVIAKKLSGDVDGEIQFEYGERFYHFRKIIVSDGTAAKHYGLRTANPITRKIIKQNGTKN